MRTLRLSLMLTRRSPFRAVMLALLIAVAIVVFAVITELSRVSQDGLDDAIVRDVGLRGSYQVFVQPDLPVTTEAAFEATASVASDLGMTVWGYWEDMPAVQSECPPFEQVGKQQLRILWKSPGVVFQLPFGNTADLDTRWCITGQTIPQDALFVPGPDQIAIYQHHVYVRSDYRNLILLSTLGPINRGFIIVSGDDNDITDQVRTAIDAKFTTMLAGSGTDPTSGISVARIDQKGQNVRQAANGISTTYNVIGWGVMLLAGLGLTLMQATNARQRSWFYGLARALGASGPRITAVLAVDTLIVLVGGVCLAMLTLLATNGTVHDFALSAFGVDANVLSPALIPRLVIGLVALLTVTTVVPLVHTMRRDPLEVLEAPRD